MEAEKPLWIENLSDLSQSAFVDGRRHEIAPFQRKHVQAPLAHAFSSQNPVTVRIVRERPIPRLDNEEMVWVTNLTGNPLLEKTVTAQRWDRKERTFVDKEIENPKVLPSVITEEIRLSQEYTKNPHNPEETISVNHPPIQVVIPPFTRVPMSYTIAERITVRDASRPPESVGSVAVCRPPSAFEPNESWALDDIRLYCELVDPKHLSDNAMGIVPEKMCNNEKTLNEYKTKALQWLHFRLCDSRFRLPTEEEFLAVKKERAAKSQKGK